MPGRKRGGTNRPIIGPCPDCKHDRVARNPNARCAACAEIARKEKGKRDYARIKAQRAAKPKQPRKKHEYTMDDAGRLRNQESDTRYVLVFDALQDAPMRAGMPISAFDFDCMKRFGSFVKGTIVLDKRTQEEIVL